MTATSGTRPDQDPTIQSQANLREQQERDEKIESRRRAEASRGELAESRETAHAERPAAAPTVDRKRVEAVMREREAAGSPVSEQEAEIIAMHQSLVRDRPEVIVALTPDQLKKLPEALRAHIGQPEVESPRQDETRPGGRYMVGGVLVDALSRPIQD